MTAHVRRSRDDRSLDADYDWELPELQLHHEDDIPAALATSERTLDRARTATHGTGLQGTLVSQYPEGGVQLSPADDPLFAFCEERGIAVHVHVGLSGSPAGTPALAHSFQNAFTGAFRFYDPPVRMSELVYHRVLDRFPRLTYAVVRTPFLWNAVVSLIGGDVPSPSAMRGLRRAAMRAVDGIARASGNPGRAYKTA